jgi:hypothetical protein
MKFLSLVFVAFVLAVAAPIAATAQSLAPVSIVHRSVQSEVSGASINTPGMVDVTFVNHRSSPATRVSFALVSHGSRLASLHAVGTFSQGVEIEKSFATHAPEHDQTIMLSSVTFADGSSWQNPNVPRGTFKAPPYQ